MSHLPMFQNLKAMPGILKWLTAVSFVPIVFFLATLIPNGSIQVNGRPMANAAWWSCGAGWVVTVLAIMMTAAEILLLQRSKYARPAFLAAMAFTVTSALPIEKLIEPNVRLPLWSVITNLALVALIAWYLYASRAVQKYLHPKSFP